MATTKEAVVIIFDVGKNTLKKDTNQRTFFEKAKECIEKIIQRKIFSEPKDEVGLILMGTEQTHNNLNSTLGTYNNITEAFKISLANWQMLRILDKEIHPSKEHEADWLDALVVAIDFLKTHTLGMKYGSFKIVLLTTFSTIVNEHCMDSVIETLKDMKIGLIVITDNIEYRVSESQQEGDIETEEEAIFSQKIEKSEDHIKSEQLITNILKETEGVLCDFDQAFIQLIYFEKSKKRSLPWNCKLEIGSQLDINISAFVYIKKMPSLPTWKTQGPSGACRRFIEYFVDDRPWNLEKDGDFIRGYMYGTTAVPFDQSLGMSFNSGEKCFKCIGFTGAQLIRDEHLTGSGVWIVTSQKGCPASEKKLIALIAAMRESNMALVARYVYRSQTKVKMMVLFPHKLKRGTEDYKAMATLSMVELYFADNHKYIEFPSLKSKRIEPSQEQLNAVDELINSMNLMNANDNGGEAFPNKKIIDPSIQYTYRALAQRAIYPTQPVPIPESDILELVNAPKKIKASSIDAVAKMKELFPLENLVKPGKSLHYKKLQQIPSDVSANNVVNLSDVPAESTVVTIGTINPAENFALLLNQGEKFSTLSTQMQNVISDLVFKMVIAQDEKLEKALMIYREEAKLLGAYRYNEWITEFKKTLLERNKIQFWENIIVRNHFGLITSSESEMSTISDEEAMAFYSVTSGKGIEQTNDDGADEDQDVDDLLGNM